MKFRSKPLTIIMVALLCLNYSGLISAKEKVGKDRELIRRLQRSLAEEQSQRQQVEQEKSALIEKTNQLDLDLKNALLEQKKISNQVEVYQRQKQALQVELKTAKAELDVLNQKLSRLEIERNNLTQQGQLLNDELTNAKKDNSELKAQNIALKTNFDAQWAAEQTAKKSQEVCEAKNKQLYQYSKTLINNYQNPTFWKSIKQSEPIFGFGNVALENLLQEYKDKIDQEHIVNSK